MTTQLRKHIVNSFFRRLLQVFINRQNQIVAGFGFLPAQNSNGLARNVNFDLLAAVFAANIFIVNALQTEFANDVARLVALIFFSLKLGVGNFADVAESMCALLLERVISKRLNFDNHAGILLFLLLDNRNNVLRHVGANSNRVEAGMHGNFLLNFFKRHVQKFGDALDDFGFNRLGQGQ